MTCSCYGTIHGISLLHLQQVLFTASDIRASGFWQPSVEIMKLTVHVYILSCISAAGNESCPQPQTSEHLAAIEIMKLKHIIILQNKIDLVKETQAQEQYDQILKFVQGNNCYNNKNNWEWKWPHAISLISVSNVITTAVHTGILGVPEQNGDHSNVLIFMSWLLWAKRIIHVQSLRILNC